jgi:hypothetical protein
MEMSSQIHALAALPPIPVGQEARYAPDFVCMGRRREKEHYCPSRKLNPRRLARGLVPILTELPRILQNKIRSPENNINVFQCVETSNLVA